MPGKSENAFPLYHRIGKAIQPVINSKYWLLIVIGLAILLYLPVLFSGFYGDDFGHRLGFNLEAGERLGWTVDMRPEWWNLYGFSIHESEELFTFLLDQGYLSPWWAADTISVGFFRPLASAMLALDFSLWPSTPLPIHIHSLLWFILLIGLIYRLYKDLAKSVTVAGLGILLIVLDDIFVGPVGWISNRHALIAMVFGVLCLILYNRGVERKNWGLIGGAYALMAVALFTSEMGLVTFAYLFAHAVVLDRDKPVNRVLRIAPFVVIIVAWRVIYSMLGYGVRGSTLYVDPITSPARFIGSMATRLPVNLFTAVGLPIASIEMVAAPQALGFIAALCALAVVLYAVIVFPALKKHRLAAFWLIGILCALVPISAGVPGNRNLSFISLGLMGLISQLFVDVAKLEKSDLAGFWRVLLKIHVPVLVILYMVFSPIAILAQPGIWHTTNEIQLQAVDFGDDPALSNQHVYIVNPPGVSTFTVGMFEKAYTDEPIPASINYLSPGFMPVEIRRLDDYTIHVVPEAGYAPPPGMGVDPASGIPTPINEMNVYRAIDNAFYYDPDHLNQVGQTVELSQFTVKVAAMTDDGRIAEVIFTFAEPLESDRYLWLAYDAASQSYQKVEMPPVGETRVYP